MDEQQRDQSPRTQLCTNKPASRKGYRQLLGTFDYARPCIYRPPTIFEYQSHEQNNPKPKITNEQSKPASKEKQFITMQGQNSSQSESKQQMDKSEQPQNEVELDLSQYPSNPFPPRQIFELILQHFSKNSRELPNAARIEYLLLQIRQNMSLRQIMEKFDIDDLKRISQHKRFLESLQKNYYQLSAKQIKNRLFYNKNYRTFISDTYRQCKSIRLDMNQFFKSLSNRLKNDNPSYQKQLLSAFIQTLFKRISDENSINQTLILSDEDQMIKSRIHDIENQEQIDEEQELLRGFRTPDEKPYDLVSKYGIFRNKAEEKELSKENVLNWRLHRTIYMLEKYGLMNPHANIKSARNIAVYIIKLTDRHIQTIMEKTMKIAKLTLRATVQNKEVNEFSYFQRKIHRSKFGKVKDFQKKYGQTEVSRLFYPNHFHIYRELRKKQFLAQEKLYQILKYQVPSKAIDPKPKSSKKHKNILKDFLQPPPVNALLQRIYEDEQYQQRVKDATYAHIHIEPRHIASAIENHPFYRKHLVFWRIKTIYF